MTDWDLFDRPAPLVNMASRSFLRLGERRVKPHGFSIGQLPVLYLLRDGKAMSQRDLARAAKVEQPSMAQILARMERDGLLRRRAIATVPVTVEYSITPLGSTLAQAVDPLRDWAEQNLKEVLAAQRHYDAQRKALAA